MLRVYDLLRLICKCFPHYYGSGLNCFTEPLQVRPTHHLQTPCTPAAEPQSLPTALPVCSSLCCCKAETTYWSLKSFLRFFSLTLHSSYPPSSRGHRFSKWNS